MGEADGDIPKKEPKYDASFSRIEGAQGTPTLTVTLQKTGIRNSRLHLRRGPMQTDATTASTLRRLGIPVGRSFLPVHTIRRSSETPGMLGVEYFSRTASIPHSFNQFSAATRTREERHMAGHVLGQPDVPLTFSSPQPLQAHLNRFPTPTSTKAPSIEKAFQSHLPVTFGLFRGQIAGHDFHYITNLPWRLRMQSQFRRCHPHQSVRKPEPILGSK